MNDENKEENSEEIHAKYIEMIKEIEANYNKAIEIFKKNFKELYENSGLYWTEEKDEEIEFAVGAILTQAISISVKEAGKFHLTPSDRQSFDDF